MADRIGQQLGNYRLIRLLGEGGFAEVYLGDHIHLGTKAAIKILHTQLSSDDIDGFRTEARTIARLVHPSIVRVLEFGIEGKIPFLVMDYASTGTLRQRHPKGTILPLSTIVTYVKQVADALQYAHDEKLIHRDVKPENMLVGRRGEILLSDFGIALVAQSSRYQSTQEMAGTMAYMPPEQIQGKPRPASDQYALGIVVYEWLTGGRPFQGSAIEIVTQHLAIPPTPLREKVPTILPDVEQVVLTALAKESRNRFATVQAFANALEQASQSDAATFVKPSVPVIRPVPVVTPSGTPMVQLSRVIMPPGPPRTLPATLPPPPKQPIADIKPVGTVIYTYRGHYLALTHVAWSPDGKRIASASEDRTVQVWDATTGDKIITYHGQSSWVHAIALSPDGKCIASAYRDNTAQVWDATTGSKLSTYQGHSNCVNAIAWSPDGKRIASGSGDSTVQVWDAITGDKIIIYQGHSGGVNALAWSPDGKRIASGSRDSTVQVWNATTGDKIIAYHGHTNVVEAVALLPNSRYVASGGADKTIQVWDATTGDKIVTCQGHTGTVTSLTLSPDGKHIASASTDKTAQVWQVL